MALIHEKIEHEDRREGDKRDGKAPPEPWIKRCGNCESPIADDDTSCGSCGATDFED